MKTPLPYSAHLQADAFKYNELLDLSAQDLSFASGEVQQAESLQSSGTIADLAALQVKVEQWAAEKQCRKVLFIDFIRRLLSLAMQQREGELLLPLLRYTSVADMMQHPFALVAMYLNANNRGQLAQPAKGQPKVALTWVGGSMMLEGGG